MKHKKTHHRKKESATEKALHRMERGLRRLSQEASPWHIESIMAKTWHDDYLARKL